MTTSEYQLMASVEDTHWWYASLRRNIQRSFSKSPTRIKVLDAGCGTGRNSVLLQELGFSVVSLDLSPAALALAKRRNLKKLFLGSITKLPFKKQVFTALICCDVMGALTKESEVRKSIEEFHRVLQPGGLCVIQVAAIPWLYSTHDQAVKNSHRFTKSDFEPYFNQRKWQIRRSTYRYFLLFPLIALSKLWQKIQQLPSEESDLGLPPPPLLNSLLDLIMKLEDFLTARLNWPVGSSLYIEVIKKT